MYTERDLAAPGAHTGQPRTAQRHAAIAAVDCVEILHAVVAELVAGGCELVVADNQQHVRGIGAEVRRLGGAPGG